MAELCTAVCGLQELLPEAPQVLPLPLLTKALLPYSTMRRLAVRRCRDSAAQLLLLTPVL